MEYKELINKEFRKISSMALYNNLFWWAKGNHEVNEESLKKAFMLLDRIVLEDFRSEFVIKLPRNKVLYRARNIEPEDYTKKEKCIFFSDNRLYGFNWQESKEPPEWCDKDGRTSRKGDSALYLADDEITACMEVRTKIRQLVSVAQFELNQDVEIINFSRLQYDQPLNKYDEEYDIDVRTFLGSVFALFTYPVYDGNYGVTQKIVDHFRQYGFNGIAYRSLYTEKVNYTFFEDARELFIWKSSRVLINYATANLFVSMDDIEEHKDINNKIELEKEVSKQIRQDMLNATKYLFTSGVDK